jgi:hypothetical protein
MSERERRLLIVSGWLRLLTPHEWSQVECHLASTDRPDGIPRDDGAEGEDGSRPEHPGR